VKLAICGDSWFSIDRNALNSSFSELMCSQQSWELLNLARPGASNFAICLQIDHAVKLGADFIVINTTEPGRIEVPLNGKTYSKNRVGENISYPQAREDGISDLGQQMMQDPTIAVDPIGNFFGAWESYKDFLPKTFLNTLQSYIADMFDLNTKLQYDSWAISDACRRLLDKKIPFLVLNDQMYSGYSDRLPDYDFEVDLDWVPNKYLIHYNDFALRRELTVDNEYIFHYSLSSAKILADYIFTRIQDAI
jgi:hypothetical protein